jgi:hypothetical protein
MEARSFRRPPSLSAPSELGLGLIPAAGGSAHLPLLPIFRDDGSPLATRESGSPVAVDVPVGASSPAFYHAPLVPGGAGSPLGDEGSPRPARPSYVGGGLLGRGVGYSLPHSQSLGRMEHAFPPPMPSSLALRAPGEAAGSELPPAPRAARGIAGSGGHGGDDCCSGPSCCEAAHVWAMRFAVHIVLLSIFETLFFWQFVGPTEDKALLDLVDSYVGGTLRACPRWNATERVVVEAFMALLLNRTAIRSTSAAAAAKRAHFNGALLRNSWLYVAGLALLFLLLSALGVRRKGGLWSLPWRVLFLENIALIAMLGLYELMFFTSVVLPYQVRGPPPGSPAHRPPLTPYRLFFPRTRTPRLFLSPNWTPSLWAK